MCRIQFSRDELRLVEDEKASVSARCEALRQLAHPPLSASSIVGGYGKTLQARPCPLRAIATLAYAREVQLRKNQQGKSGRQQKQDEPSNALGII
jgi:hypothetical protein